MTRTISRIAIVISSVLLMSCATNIHSSRLTNPPPSAKFSSFSRFELKPVELSPTYSHHGANLKATAKIQEYFDSRVKPIISRWNEKGGPADNTLLIEPRIEQIKFIGVGARIFAGPMAGSSAVVMKVRYIDKSNGKIIAEPEFYQRAAAMSGAFTFGGQDNAMLARITTLVADYNTRNYDQRVGGETGAPHEGEEASYN